MKRIALFFFVLTLGTLAAITVYAQAVQYKAAESYMPPVVRVTREMPDKGRVCVEPAGGGIDACKSIFELRKWALSSAAKEP